MVCTNESDYNDINGERRTQGLFTLNEREFLPAATKLGQGNVFTGVCDSVNRVLGCLPRCMLGYPPRADTSSEPTPPKEQTPRRRHPPRADTPRSRHPPGAVTPQEQTPPGSRPPPREQAPAYGQRAAGTHPTGKHSCFLLSLLLLNVNIKLGSL